MIRMETPDLELKALNGFIGTQNYWRHMGVNLTDGVKYIMDNGYAWFVTDTIIAIAKTHNLLIQPFLTINLKLTGNNTADLIIEDGDYNELYRQHYEFTDAKRELKLFFTDNVLMLNSEY